jgi:hypothetical protein
MMNDTIGDAPSVLPTYPTPVSAGRVVREATGTVSLFARLQHPLNV